MSNTTDFGPALLSTERVLDWSKAPEVGFRMPWMGGLAELNLLRAFNSRDLCFFIASNCLVPLSSVATVAGGSTLAALGLLRDINCRYLYSLKAFNRLAARMLVATVGDDSPL